MHHLHWLIRRLSDRLEALRKSWFHIISPPEPELPEGDRLERAHDEISKTLQRSLLALISFSFFCGFVIFGTPDSDLIAGDSMIRVPIPLVPAYEMRFVGFLIVGPLILVAIDVYLHSFVRYWRTLSGVFASKALPYLFNLPYWSNRLLTGFLFYLLTPAMLALFAWKSVPLRLGRWLALTFLIFTIGSLWIKIPRRSRSARRKNVLPWLPLGILLVAPMVVPWRSVSEFRQVNLFGADLAGKDLRNLSLRGADLRGADLSGASLSRTDLSEVDLSDTLLLESDLSGAILYKSVLSGVDLRGAVLREAQLPEAILPDALLSGVDLVGADLSKADLRGSDLSGADLSNAILEGAWLDLANMRRADLSGADLRDAELREADLTLATLLRARVQASFEGTILTGANLSYADLEGADLTIAVLGGANFFGVKNLTQRQLNRSECVVEPIRNLPRNLAQPPLCTPSTVVDR